MFLGISVLNTFGPKYSRASSATWFARFKRWLNIVRGISSEGYGRIKYHTHLRGLMATATPLLRFLEQAVSEGIDRAHMFEYYKALSRCGSFRAVKPLKKILMESKLTDMFSNLNAVHKKGSALALGILGTEEALDVLRAGVKSMRPDIRLACQFALEKVK